MPDELKNTDESAPQNTEESSGKDVSESIENSEAEPSASEEEAQPKEVSDKLDFNELIPTGKRSKDSRKGKSRSEYSKSKEETPDEKAELKEVLERVQILEEENAKYKKNTEYMETFKADQEQQQIQNTIVQGLADRGVDPKTFNEHYAEAFKAEQQSLMDEGLSAHKATEAALRLTVAPLQQQKAVEEVEARKEGRKNASLPPQPTSTPTEQFELLPKAEYENLVEKRGGVYFKKYNAFWESRGKDSPWKEAA